MSGKNGSNGVLSRDAFFAACKANRVVTVEIPDCGKVNIRKLTLGQLRSFDKTDDNYERAKLLIMESVVDNSGETIFKTPEEVADTLEMTTFKVISEAVTEVNGLKAGATADATKNSEAATTSALS